MQTTNGKCITNGFNDFYVNIGPTLASKIGNTDIDPTDYVKSINSTSTVSLEQKKTPTLLNPRNILVDFMGFI